MKRKLILSLMVMALVAGLAIKGYTVEQFNSDQKAKLDYAGGAASPYVSSNITVNNRLLGYVFSDTADGTITIYDDTQTTAARIIFRDSVLAKTAVYRELPYPYDVGYGIVSVPSTTTGRVTLIYE